MWNYLKMTNQEYKKLIADVIDWAYKKDPEKVKKWEYFLNQYLIAKGWESEARKQFISMGSETDLAGFLGLETNSNNFYNDVHYCSDRMHIDRLFRLHIQYRTLRL